MHTSTLNILEMVRDRKKITNALHQIASLVWDFHLACVHSILTHFEGQGQGCALSTEIGHLSSNLRNFISHMNKDLQFTIKSAETTAEIVILFFLHW